MKSAYDISRQVSGALRGVGAQGVTIGLLIIALMALLLVPLPRPLLDVLIVLNLVVSLVLVLVGLFVGDTRRLSAFPTVLLLTTLYRLALNVSSTRLILLNGDKGMDAAGSVIEAFGSFVVQGDFVVGAIIFAIIAIVNFVVIAKGSARVAEVSARFTLDALPGKQLAIDSDLRAGTITKEEAQSRRAALTEESQFFGAMDGAMRFVQGDAIAGFIIAFINSIGGVSIGLSRGLDFSTAVDQFGVLTIGDGLVNILPSLLISVCAGVVVTRVSKASSPLGEDATHSVASQFLAEPRALIIGALVILTLSLLPGLPFLPFFFVGALLLLAGSMARPAETPVLESVTGSRPAFPALPGGTGELQGKRESFAEQQPLLGIGSVRALTLEIDPALLGGYFDDPEVARGFKDATAQSREKLFRERGVLLPEVSLIINRKLEPGQYTVQVREQPHRSGKIDTGLLFVSANAGVLSSLGLTAAGSGRHPLTYCSSVWMAPSTPGVAALERLGITVIRPFEFLALEVSGAALGAVTEIFGLNEVRQRLQQFQGEHPALIEEVFGSNVLNHAEFSDLVRRLVRERVNIRDFKLILEAVMEFRSLQPDESDRQEWLAELHSFVRRCLARQIVLDAAGPGGKLRTFLLSEELEEEFRSAVSSWDRSRTIPPLSPEVENSVKRSAAVLFNPVLERGAVPVVVLCPSDIRVAVEEFFTHQPAGRDWFRTLAYEELGGQYKFESVGVLGI